MFTSEQIAAVNQAIDYVNLNLHEAITAERIAEHCCFSRHYFNRLFRAVTGENLYSFVKRQKLETAASLIFKHSNLSITDVAAEMGYSPSNFTVAFQKHFGWSPSECREGLVPGTGSGQGLDMVRQIRDFQTRSDPEEYLKTLEERIEIRTLPEMFLNYRRFIGPYCDLNAAWQRFILENPTLPGERPRQFCGLTYSDPLFTSPERCIYDLCVEVSEPRGSQCHRLPRAEYVCFHYTGHIRELFQRYNDFLSFWIPVKGPRFCHRSCLEFYHPCDIPLHVSIDICIPLQPFS